MAMSGFFPNSPSQDREKVKRFVKEAGNNPAIVDELAKVKDLPKNLYLKLFNLYRYTLKSHIQKEISEAWQLLVVSGLNEAFAKAKELYQIDKNSQTAGGLNALHLAALSDEPKQLDNALNLGIALDSQSSEGLTVLDYAALSGNVKMIEHVQDLEKQQAIKLKSTGEKGPNALMLAAYSGKLPAVKAIEVLAQDSERNIQANALYANSYTAANFAMKSNNQPVIKHFSTNGLMADLDKQDQFKYGEVAYQSPRFDRNK